ncbi:MAG TPA: glycosyl transferase family 2, partial [Sulfitobacter pontiacus]|nr:glycosyl transferase family 2 [Sulfitobacter pontiacus]
MNTPSAPPGITVVIPHLNQHKALARCLAALDAGTCKPVEVIVVDNGSARSPQGVVNDYPWVSLIHQPIPGPGPARNLGAARAQGDVLAFLDADCLPDAHWLAHIAAHMAR